MRDDLRPAEREAPRHLGEPAVVADHHADLADVRDREHRGSFGADGVRLERPPREHLAVPGGEAAGGSEDDGGVVEGVAVAFDDGARDDPPAGALRDASDGACEGSRDRLRVLVVSLRGVDERMLTGQVQLGEDVEVGVGERAAEHPHFLLELLQRRRRVEGDRADLRRHHGEDPAHGRVTVAEGFAVTSPARRPAREVDGAARAPVGGAPTEVEVRPQVAEPRRILRHERPGIRPAVGSRVDTSAAEEVVLDEPQVGVGRQLLVVDVAAPARTG